MIDDITSKLNKEEIEEILKDYKRKLEEDKEENEETTQQRKVNTLHNILIYNI